MDHPIKRHRWAAGILAALGALMMLEIGDYHPGCEAAPMTRSMVSVYGSSHDNGVVLARPTFLYGNPPDVASCTSCHA